jgi:Dyp-type peroxidase family
MSRENRLTSASKADIQGFITSAFGHLPWTAYLFLQVHDRAMAQEWMRRLLPRLTTANSWRRQPDEPKLKPERTLSLALTYAGIAALGLSETSLNTFPTEFREGMASPQRSRILGDTGESAPTHWEVGGPLNEPVHAIFILNARSQQELGSFCDEEREALRTTQGGVTENENNAQYGERPENGREHFGFFDGVAQPRIKGIQGEGVGTGEFILGYLNEYGFYPVSPVVPPADDPECILPASANPFLHPAGYRDLGMNGSFVVYRKLGQDVAAFWRFLQNESIRIRGKPDPELMIWLAAKMVGRWPSGAPLTLAPGKDQPELRSDDFLYAEADPDGLKCPIGAHIRRTHPRDRIGNTGQVESLHMTARHRILRRGRLYGPTLFDSNVLAQHNPSEVLHAILNLVDDGQPRGVHFVTVNASIKDQFEFIQQVWVNNPNFSGLVDNRDPLVGDNDPSAETGGMLVPGRYFSLRTSPLPRFVTVHGGAYLFMPGLTAFRYLSEIRITHRSPLHA